MKMWGNNITSIARAKIHHMSVAAYLVSKRRVGSTLSITDIRSNEAGSQTICVERLAGRGPPFWEGLTLVQDKSDKNRTARQTTGDTELQAATNCGQAKRGARRLSDRFESSSFQRRGSAYLVPWTWHDCSERL